jgi:glycosyltransferase involved in cell wall biosynthesis
MNVAIILPAFNEAQTIEATIRDFHIALPDALICVVDNNSRDGTYEVAKRAFQNLPNCNNVLIRENRQGKSFAVRRAFTEIDADIFVMSDADCTYLGADLHRMLQPIIEGSADMVVGDRQSSGDYMRENKRPLHIFGNRLVCSLINTLFNSKLNDILSGYRAFTRVFVKTFPILSDGFELETEVTLHALDKRFRVFEVPISYRDRPSGSHSKLSTFRDGLKVLGLLFSILRHNKPLFFFGWLSVAFASLGIGIGVIPIWEFIKTSRIYHLPSAVLASALMICALVSFAIALILDRAARADKQSFELRVISLHSVNINK